MRPDPAGELLGTPLVVSGFMAGRQQANPVDVQTWARELAHLLVRIHAIRPTARQRRGLYAGNEHGLYFLSGEWPRKLAGRRTPASSSDVGPTLRQNANAAFFPHEPILCYNNSRSCPRRTRY